MAKRKVKPTEMQKKAVDNIISGKFKTIKASMTDAGYSDVSAEQPSRALAETRGVEIYLASLSAKAKKRWDSSLEDKVMDTYMDGLDATKLFGKDGIEHPDWMARKSFADRFSEFFGWVSKNQGPSTPQFNQYNFFSMPAEKRKAFNDNFKGFLKRYYKGEEP